MQLVYLSTVRLPTTKAHGLQIVRMCEAFARAGAVTTLVHPIYHDQPDGLPEDLWRYYGVPNSIFEVVSQPTLAAKLRLSHRAPWVSVGSALLTARHQRHWAREAGLGPGDVVYTRSILGLSALSRLRDRLGFTLGVEIHALPASRRAAKLAGLQRCDLVVSISEVLRGRLVAEGVSAEKIIVEHDGYEEVQFRDLPDQATARSQLGLQPGFIVGFVGTFSHVAGDKGVPTLVAGMAALADRPDCWLCLVGSNDTAADSTRLRAVAIEAGVAPDRVRVVGRVSPERVPLYLTAFDICVNPLPDTYHNQGASPLKLFEYLAAGRASVVTDLPATVEVVVDGYNALIVPPSDSVALGAALRRLYDEPSLCQQLAQNALVTAQHYTWGSRASRLLDEASRRAAQRARA